MYNESDHGPRFFSLSNLNTQQANSYNSGNSSRMISMLLKSSISPNLSKKFTENMEWSPHCSKCKPVGTEPKAKPMVKLFVPKSLSASYPMKYERWVIQQLSNHKVIIIARNVQTSQARNIPTLCQKNFQFF